MRKDIVDLKRNVNEEVHEKEAVQQTAHELRNNVKRLEGEKTELSRIIQEAKQRIGGKIFCHTNDKAKDQGGKLHCKTW